MIRYNNVLYCIVLYCTVLVSERQSKGIKLKAIGASQLFLRRVLISMFWCCVLCVSDVVCAVHQKLIESALSFSLAKFVLYRSDDKKSSQEVSKRKPEWKWNETHLLLSRRGRSILQNCSLNPGC